MSRRLAPVPDQPRRAICYVRVSALMGREGDDFHSPELQERAVRAAIPGMKIVETVPDLDVTGTNFNREGIERIRQLVEAGRVDVVAIHDLSRLGRNVLESLDFIRWLRARNVSVVSALERIDDSPEGQLMLVNLLAIAEYRAGDIGRRWGQVISHRTARGQHHGKPPRGYLKADNGHLVVDPAMGPVVSRAFTAYGDGVAIGQIRKDLNAATGGHVATGVIKTMFRNPAYLGRVRVSGPRTGPVESLNAHEPLVDQRTWDRVQRRLQADMRMPARTLSPAYSLTGLGRCGVCDGRTNIRKDSDGVPRMYCRHHAEKTGPCAGCGRITLAAAEQVVLERVQAYISRLKGNVAAREAAKARANRAGTDAAMLERELIRTREAMVRVARKWGLGQMPDEAYEQAMEGFKADEQRLVAAIADRREDVDLAPQAVIKLGEALIAMWPKMTGGERNRALREIVKVVTLKPAAIYREAARHRVKVVFR